MEKFVDISALLDGDVGRIDFGFEFEVPDGVSHDDVTFPRPVRVDGRVTDSGGYVEMTCRADVDYSTFCARCLKPVDGTLSLDWSAGVAVSGTLESDDTDDYVFAENGRVDVLTPLVEQIILEFPSKVLCSGDCRGLCPKCGKDLNEGECSCPKKEPDPRWAPLAKLRDRLKDENT